MRSTAFSAPVLNTIPKADAEAKKVAQAAAAQAAEWKGYASVCPQLATQTGVYKLDYLKYFLGEISSTRISIESKGKYVCVDGVLATAKADMGETTVVEFENGGVTCTQRTTTSRLSTESIRRTGYAVAGKYSTTMGKRIMLEDCVIEEID